MYIWNTTTEFATVTRVWESYIGHIYILSTWTFGKGAMPFVLLVVFMLLWFKFLKCYELAVIRVIGVLAT